MVQISAVTLTIHFSLKPLDDFWKVICNSEKGRGQVYSNIALPQGGALLLIKQGMIGKLRFRKNY